METDIQTLQLQADVPIATHLRGFQGGLSDIKCVCSNNGNHQNDHFRCKVCATHADNYDPGACTFLGGQVETHLNTIGAGLDNRQALKK